MTSLLLNQWQKPTLNENPHCVNKKDPNSLLKAIALTLSSSVMETKHQRLGEAKPLLKIMDVHYDKPRLLPV
jgi:hypothetical protein